MKEAFSLGLMSGSSLDGLDICYSKICSDDDEYSFEILACDTIPYSDRLVDKLKRARELSSLDLSSLHVELGDFFGDSCLHFISHHRIYHLDFIASHGHTVFHFPDRGFSLQIGDAQRIAYKTGFATLSHLRNNDIAHGGTGAPIVPIGDRLFFQDYLYCLNLGGIMNISHKINDTIVAYDLGACNQVLNHYARILNKTYDEDGLIGRSGQFYEPLFNQLNEVDFFKNPYPKSLDNEFSQKLIHLIDSFSLNIEDILHSFYHHIAYQILLASSSEDEILCTGGGAHNLFLIDLMRDTYKLKLALPSVDIINHKESLIMSLMGIRYFENKYNILSSVTGATKNTINGQLFVP